MPEVEPLPPAYEEDENEEIGRPEGPLEERHVDPYAVVEEPAGYAPSAARTGRGGGRSVEPGFVLPTLPEPEDEWPADSGTEEEEPRGFEAEPAATGSASGAGDAVASEREPEPDLADDEAIDERPGATPSSSSGVAPAPAREEPRFGRRPGRTKRGR